MGAGSAQGREHRPTPPRARHHRFGKSWHRSLIALVAYAVGGLAAQWPAWPGDPNLIRQGDQTQNAWNLAWTPFALLHGHRLFSTLWVNYPRGMNLGQNNLAPLLGLLTLPITVCVSPIASLNLLIWLSFPLSAFSMFWVLRRFGLTRVAAFIGGGAYGFSPYIVGQGLDHMIIDFVPLPPLTFLALYELFVRRTGHRLAWGVAVGAFELAQYFISAEIAVTTALTAAIALTVLGLSHARSILPAVRYALPGVGVGASLAGAMAAYPVWVTLAGPYHIEGSAHAGGLAADLFGPLFPTTLERFAPSSFFTIGMRLVGGDFPENGSYVGFPLLVLLVAVVLWRRRDHWIWFGAAMVVVMFILSLGTQLEVDNHLTFLKLPFYLLAQLPVFNNILSVRLSLYVWMFIAVILALGAEAWIRSWRALPNHDVAPGRRGRVWLLTLLGVFAVSVVSLIPRWPYGNPSTGVPSYFAGPAVRAIPEGSVALISPYPSAAEVAPELWQAMSGMRFKMLGGYGLFADPNGAADTYPAVTYPKDVESFIWSQATGGRPSDYRLDLSTNLRRLPMDLRTYLRRNHVWAVIWVNGDADPQSTFRLFSKVLGKPSYNDNTVAAWYNVPQLLRL